MLAIQLFREKWQIEPFVSMSTEPGRYWLMILFLATYHFEIPGWISTNSGHVILNGA